MRRTFVWYSFAAGLLGLGLFAALFFITGISPASFAHLIAHVYWPAFAGITLCSFLYVLLGAAKWHFISGTPAPRPFFYTHYTAQAMLIGQFLPPPVAIAVSRAAVMRLKQNTALKKGFLNALYDLGFDFTVAAILIPASLLQGLYSFHFYIWLALGIGIICGASFILAQTPRLLPAKWLTKWGLMDERRQGLLAPRLIALMMFLSSARFALVILRLMLGAIAIGVAVPLGIVAYAAPPATMSSLLMLTPANLGIAEWSWTYLLTLWHVPASVGAFYGVSFRILVFMAQLIVSGFCYSLYRINRPR